MRAYIHEIYGTIVIAPPVHNKNASSSLTGCSASCSSGRKSNQLSITWKTTCIWWLPSRDQSKGISCTMSEFCLAISFSSC